MATIKNWLNEFQRGHTSVFNEPREDAPRTVTTEDDNVTKIYDFVLADRHLKVHEIGISKDRVSVRKLSVRWVLHLLTLNKRLRP